MRRTRTYRDTVKTGQIARMHQVMDAALAQRQAAERTAQGAYTHAQREAQALLTDLATHLDGHADCAQADGQVHWGHVGDITEVCALLKRALGRE